MRMLPRKPGERLSVHPPRVRVLTDHHSKRPFNHVPEKACPSPHEDALARPRDAGSDPAEQVLRPHDAHQDALHATVLGGHTGAHRRRDSRGREASQLCVPRGWHDRVCRSVSSLPTKLDIGVSGVLIGVRRSVWLRTSLSSSRTASRPVTCAARSPPSTLLRRLVRCYEPIFHTRTENCPIEYFQKDSPDFINSRGESISASKQVDALAQAQSIGRLQQLFFFQCTNTNCTQYTSPSSLSNAST